MHRFVCDSRKLTSALESKKLEKGFYHALGMTVPSAQSASGSRYKTISADLSSSVSFSSEYRGPNSRRIRRIGSCNRGA